MEHQSTGSGGRDATIRRDFLRKTAIGAAFVVPAMQTVTSTALAQNGIHGQTGGTFIVQVTVDSDYGGSGSVSPPGAVVQVPLGGSRLFTVTPDPGSVIYKYGVDGSHTGPYGTAQQVLISDNGQPVRTLYVLFEATKG
jgi:hypothetical protein